MIEAGLPEDHPALVKGAEWLLSRQTRTVGDWKESAPAAEPGGWYFQFENERYPDVDDSAVVLMALAKLRLADREVQQQAMARGYRWVMAMQGSDGGWGAYDKDNNKMVFNLIPFADHRALLDPSTADLAGRCLEMLGALGYDRRHPAVRPALEFIRREQESDGSWYGRWGVNYIYGTWSVLAGLKAIGEDMSSESVRRAIMWLQSKQNPDGGWGNPASPMPTRPRPARAIAHPRRRLGLSWLCCRPAYRIRSPRYGGLIICFGINGKMDLGTRSDTPARGSPVSSTSAIIGTANTFLSGRSPCIATSGPVDTLGRMTCVGSPRNPGASGLIQNSKPPPRTGSPVRSNMPKPALSPRRRAHPGWLNQRPREPSACIQRSSSPKPLGSLV